MLLNRGPNSFGTPSGGGGLSLSFDADITYWWAPEEGITLAGSDVTAWLDKVASVDMAPVDASLRPVYNATGINGVPSVDVLGTDLGMQATIIGNDATCCFVLVANFTSASASSGRILSARLSLDDWSEPTNFSLLRDGSTSAALLYRDDSPTASMAVGYGVTKVFMINCDGTDTRVYINDVHVGTRAVSSVLSATSLGLFREAAAGGFEDAKGQAGDLMVINRALTAGERTEAYAALANKYGL